MWIAIGTTVSAVTAVALFGSLLWRRRRRYATNEGRDFTWNGKSYLASPFVFFLISIVKQVCLAENKSISQEVQLLHVGEGGIGNDYSYDIFRGGKQVGSQEFPLFPLDLTLVATKHFSDENKLGEGGFGPVYKVIIDDGFNFISNY